MPAAQRKTTARHHSLLGGWCHVPAFGSCWSYVVFPAFFLVAFHRRCSMSKHSLLGYFHPAEPVGEAQACLNEIRRSEAVLRKTRRISKLEPYIPVIAHYLRNTDASLQEICSVLKFRHNLKFHKSTLSRFILNHQHLTELRALHSASAPTNGG